MPVLLAMNNKSVVKDLDLLGSSVSTKESFLQHVLEIFPWLIVDG